MALLLVLGPLLLPEFRDPGAGRLDLVSAALSVAAVLAVIYGLKQVARDGFGWLPAVSMVAGLAAGAAFVRRQRRLADPLLDLRLFRSAVFTTALTTNLLSFFVGFGTLLFISQYLQLVLGLSPLAAGLWMLPSSAGFVAGSLLTPALARRFRPAVVMVASLTLAVVGLGLFTLVGSTAGLGLLVTGSVVFSLGLAPVDTLTTDLVVGSAPPERAGAASALSETAAEFGGALGIAILGVIGTRVYRSQLDGALPPGILPRAAAAARDTLGGAVAAAGHLPGQPGEVLARIARQAFTQGLHAVFAVSSAAVLGAAVLAAIQLRHLRPAPERPIGVSVMLLEAKTAIVYGAGGAIGSGVARAYAREGAEVHLAWPHPVDARGSRPAHPAQRRRRARGRGRRPGPGGGRAARQRGRRQRRHRHLLQRHLQRRRPGHAAPRDAVRGIPAVGYEGGYRALQRRRRHGPAHDPPRPRRHPRHGRRTEAIPRLAAPTSPGPPSPGSAASSRLSSGRTACG